MFIHHIHAVPKKEKRVVVLFHPKRPNQPRPSVLFWKKKEENSNNNNDELLLQLTEKETKRRRKKKPPPNKRGPPFAQVTIAKNRFSCLISMRCIPRVFLFSFSGSSAISQRGMGETSRPAKKKPPLLQVEFLSKQAELTKGI